MRRIPLALLAVALLGGTGARQGGKTLRYLALGDSYTIGEGVGPAERWPNQLAALLAAEGLALAGAPETPEIIARTGWTTDELSAAISEAKPRKPYDLVTLLIGINDQYRGKTVEAYRPEFRRLLAAAIGFAGNRPERVLVLSIPDWGVTTFGAGSGRSVPQIAREIDAFNAVAKVETEGAGAAFLDVTGETRSAGNAPGELVADGLHPSGKQYARWAKAALPLAKRALTSRPAR